MGKSKKTKTKKKEKRPVRLERRVRVTFFLPAGRKEDKEAVWDVARSLDSQFLVGTVTRFTVTGFTHSGIPTEVPEMEMIARQIHLVREIFFGHWWYEEEREGHPGLSKISVVEPVVFFLIDYPMSAEEWELDQVLQQLKEEIFSIYAEHGNPQQEIWMVKQDVYRYT